MRQPQVFFAFLFLSRILYSQSVQCTLTLAVQFGLWRINNNQKHMHSTININAQAHSHQKQFHLECINQNKWKLDKKKLNKQRMHAVER